jgi:hypothetical protein
MPESTSPAKDAIIFVPGLSGPIDQSLEGIAHRIAVECERNCRTETVRFTISPGGKQQKGESTTGAKFCTIFRQDVAGDQPVIDVYSLNYREALTKKYRQLNSLSQLFRLFIIILNNLGRFLRALLPQQRQKRTLEKLQILFATLIMSLLLCYLVILGMAVYQTAIQIKGLWVSGTKASATNTATKSGPIMASGTKAIPHAPPIRWPQSVIIIVAVLECFFPRGRQSLTDSAMEYVCTIEYLSWDMRKAVIGGHLSDLLENITQCGSYRHVHLLAFSFGTVLVLDQLFPTGNPPGPRFSRVNALMTIGCPFDLIRLFWPHYFQNRSGREGVPQRWLNVYAPMDVMGSNFRDDPKVAEATHTVGFLPGLMKPILPENIPYAVSDDKQTLGFWGALTFAGLRAHTIYWESEFESELSCFSPLITRLYQEDHILS